MYDFKSSDCEKNHRVSKHPRELSEEELKAIDIKLTKISHARYLENSHICPTASDADSQKHQYDETPGYKRGLATFTACTIRVSDSSMRRGTHVSRRLRLLEEGIERKSSHSWQWEGLKGQALQKVSHS